MRLLDGRAVNRLSKAAKGRHERARMSAAVEGGQVGQGRVPVVRPARRTAALVRGK